MPNTSNCQLMSSQKYVSLIGKSVVAIVLICLMTEAIKAQNDKGVEIISAEEALRGQTSMSVYIDIKGIKDIPESVFQSDIETKLQQNGITVLPLSNPLKFPLLLLSVGAGITTEGNGSYITYYHISLEYRQLFPISPNRVSKLVKATTWRDWTYGVMPSIQALSIRRYADDLTTEFIGDWLKVNPAKPTQSTAPHTSVNRQDAKCITSVFSVKDYIDTGITVNRGDAITIVASGSVVLGLIVGQSGPEGIGPLPTYSRIKALSHGSLVGRIRKPNDYSREYTYRDGNQLGNIFGEWAYIGNNARIVLSTKDIQSGTLEFSINDNDLGNNAGQYKVEVTVCKAP